MDLFPREFMRKEGVLITGKVLLPLPESAEAVFTTTIFLFAWFRFSFLSLFAVVICLQKMESLCPQFDEYYGFI